jgi:hypothetical protein
LFIFKWWFIHQQGIGKKVSNVGVEGKIVGKQWLFLGNGDHGPMANAQKSQ